jgi:hypothetical protein
MLKIPRADGWGTGREGSGNVRRRWLWPYAIFAVLLSLLGLAALSTVLLGGGADRAGAQFVAADAAVIEPLKGFLISMLEMIAPFDLPAWFKQVYAVLVMIALVGITLSLGVGMLLLPVFYALYRGRESD